MFYLFLYSHDTFFIFFFSSRRRHTRSDRDWSSDVCSSDLLEVERRLPVEPALRQIVWELVLVLGGALVESAERGEGRDVFAVLVVALDRAVGEAQRKGRVRVEPRPFGLEERVRDLRVGVALDSDDLVLVALAYGARLRVNRAREFEHRVA